MKIGVISDVHSNVYGLESVLQQLRGTELILCAGDITGYYPFVNEVFQLLENHNIVFIKGNHDAYLCGDQIRDLHPIELKSFEHTMAHITQINLDRLRNASSHLSVNLDGYKVVMFHGSPWNQLEEYIYPDYPNFNRFTDIDADVIILGHTHYPMVKQLDGKLVINSGSCGQPRDYDSRASFAVFDTEARNVVIERVQYDVESVCKATEKLGFDKKLIEILKRTKQIS